MKRAPGGGDLVGRSRELAALTAGLARAAEGSPGAAFVSGESGIGKTRLVAEFARRAAQTGARVLVGGCVEMSGGELPYGPIVDALRPLSRSPLREQLAPLLGPTHEELGRLLLAPAGDPGEGPASSTAARSRIFELTLELLGRLGDLSPVVLILEDLHWADRTSLDLLGFVIRSLCQQREAFGDFTRDRVYVVATYRNDELRPDNPLGLALPELAYRGVVELLSLTPLTREEMDALLRQLLPQQPSPGFVESVVARSEGNPYFAQELVADARDDGGGSVPESLRQLVLRRMARLSPDARETLRIAATIGRRATHTLLAAVSALPERRLLPALREAVEHGLVTSDGDSGSYRFRHGIAQEALYGELLPGERIALHRAIAEALEKELDPVNRHPVEIAELAHHWYAAHDPLRAVTATIEAGRSAAKVYAFAEAHQQFERAVQLCSTEAEARGALPVAPEELLREAAEAARWAGEIERAIVLVRQARAAVDDTRDPTRAALLEERLGRYLWEYGDVAGSLAADAEAARLLEGLPTSALHARVLAAHATGLMLSGQSPAALERSAQAIAVSREVSARVEEAYALTTLGVSRAVNGDVEGGLSALYAARDIVTEAGDLEDICRLYANLTFVLTSAGRLEESLTEAYAGLARARALGCETGGLMFVNACSTLFLLGRWEEATTLAQDALRQQMSPAFTSYLRVTLSDVATAVGRFDEAAELLSAAAHVPGASDDPWLIGTITASRAELALWRGDPAAARQLVHEALPLLEEPDYDQLAVRVCSLGLRAIADLARQQRVLAQPPVEDEPDVAARLRERGARCVGDDRGRVLPELAAYDLLCSAELGRSQGRSDPELWGRVVEMWSRLGEPYAAAYAGARQGEALLAHKSRRNAAVPLSRALRIAVEMGAEPLRRQIQLLAQAARVPLDAAPVPEIPRPRSTAETLKLTPREQEVLTLVAAGRTNRQIARALVISEKTASVHVSNILTKLGAANRVEAAAAAHSLRLV